MTRLAAVLVALFGLGALLIACGGGDDDDDDAGEAVASSRERCNNEAVTYQLSFIPNAQQAGFLLALDEGYFEEEGVDVTMRPGGPTVRPHQALAQGVADIGEVPLSEALSANEAGADLKLVAQIAQQNELRYIAKKENDIALDDPSDLAGKIVERRANEPEAELHLLLNEANLSEDDIESHFSEFTTDEFVADRTEVFPLRLYGHVPMLRAAGFDYPEDFNVLDPNEYDGGVATFGIYANGDFIEDNPAAVTCVLRAVRRGWEEGIADPERAKAAVANYAEGALAGEDISVNTELTLDPYASRNAEGERVEPLTIDEDYIRESAAKLEEFGVVDGTVDLDEMIVTEHLDGGGG